MADPLRDACLGWHMTVSSMLLLDCVTRWWQWRCEVAEMLEDPRTKASVPQVRSKLVVARAGLDGACKAGYEHALLMASAARDIASGKIDLDPLIEQGKFRVLDEQGMAHRLPQHKEDKA